MTPPTCPVCHAPAPVVIHTPPRAFTVEACGCALTEEQARALTPRSPLWAAA